VLSQVRSAMMGLCVTLLVLFGGYFAQDYWMVQKPLESLFEAEHHITLHSLKVKPDQVDIELTPQAGFLFTEEYIRLQEKAKQLAGWRKVVIRIRDHRTPKLEKVWNEMQFGVREGIERKEYTKIPQTVATVAKQYHVSQGVEMDDANLYVEISDGNGVLDEVIPLNITGSQVKANG
jgi:hypothetical protein